VEVFTELPVESGSLGGGPGGGFDGFADMSWRGADIELVGRGVFFGIDLVLGAILCPPRDPCRCIGKPYPSVCEGAGNSVVEP